MDGAAAAGGLIGLVIGVVIGAAIASLLILLGSRIVLGKFATFGSAFIAAIIASVVGAVLGIAVGFVIGAVAPDMVGQAPLIAGLLGLVITPSIYAAILRTGDGAKPSYVQSWLIYLVQLAVVIALGAVAVFVFQIPIPGLPVQ